MIRKLLVVLVLLVGGLAAYIAMQSPDMRVERSLTINAPPEAVFAQINDLHAWEKWSPWAKLDPQAKNTFSGPSSGVGAAMAWAGNSEVGEGKMTIEKSEKASLIGLKLEFVQPMAATNTTTFAFTPTSEGTKVTWTMEGKKNFIMKGMSLFMNCDKMIGGQFEQGLASMKVAAETTAKP